MNPTGSKDLVKRQRMHITNLHEAISDKNYNSKHLRASAAFKVLKMRNRLLFLVGLCALIFSLTAGCALADDFNANSSPYHNDRTIGSSTIDVYRFSVGSNQKAEWKVAVTSGLSLDIYVCDDDQVAKAMAGQAFESYRYENAKDTRSASNSKSSSGDYALIIGTTGTSTGSSTYSVDVTKRSLTTSEFAWNTLCYILIGVVITLVILGWIIRARRIARAIRQTPGPQQQPQAPGAAFPQGQSPQGYQPQYQPQSPPQGYPPQYQQSGYQPPPQPPGYQPPPPGY